MQHGSPDTTVLMECLAELCVDPAGVELSHCRPLTVGYHRYTANRQPGKALPFFLRLRRPHVLDLIREHNLFNAVQDQALLLVEFDQELMEKRRKEGKTAEDERGAAIKLLVEHTHSIPVRSFRVFPLTLVFCKRDQRTDLGSRSRE